MAKLSRVTQKAFGLAGSSGNYGKFGSKAAGSPVYTLDPATIQSLTAFTNEGWADAVVAGNVPELEDMNGLFLLAFYQLVYLFQEGVPEWDSGTTYYLNGIVKYGSELYRSLQNNNTNKQPDTETAYWETVIGPRGVQTGVIEEYAGSVAPTGYLMADGSAVSRTTYAALFAVCGTTYGAGDGSTTFNLPDKRRRVGVGYKSGDSDFGTLGQVGGASTHTLSLSEIPSHAHALQGPVALRFSGPLGLYGGNPGADTDTNPTNTVSAGGGGSHNNLQPYITLNYIIKT